MHPSNLESKAHQHAGHAPLTKLVFFATVASSIAMQVAHATRGGRVPLLVTIVAKSMIFQSPAELFCGGLLLYNSRLFERSMGSRKYGAFLLFTGVVSKLLELFVRNCTGVAGRTGPFNAVFANTVNHLLDIPALQHFALFGLPLNDKVFLLLAALQLMLAGGRSSLLSAVCGFAAGLLYRTNVLCVDTWTLPRVILQVVEPFGDNRPFSPMMQRGAPEQRGAPAPPRVQPSEEALEQLIAMGFDRTSASAALQQTGNNVQAALSILL